MPAPDVDALFHALGGPEASITIDAYCARGPDVIAELFAALLVPRTRAPDRDGRGVFEDQSLCMHQLAKLYPETFLAQLNAHPEVADRGALGALAQVPGPAAEQRLLATLTDRGGGGRWTALEVLLARGCTAVLPHLPRLLRDRDSMVSFSAVDGLRRWGRGEHVPALLAYIEKAAPGGLEFARDAIEAICTREGQPLPSQHPGPRLEVVATDGHKIEVLVAAAWRVPVGHPLARVDARVVPSPCAGVVSAVDHEPPHLRITIRREPTPH